MTRAATVLSAIVAICLSAGTAVIAHAQGYPDRPIKLVVPFPAGGPTDTTSRVVAERCSSRSGNRHDRKPGRRRGHHRREAGRERGRRRLHSADGVARHLRHAAAAV